ncbi:MAG: ComEC/Rec2 family competence protein [Clostridium chrysemydis]|uniref:ComEC/Rec2 family competence protein n=1 Tax=Clostridium chrysemydis TaxID=2665504 RepID=UPI003F32694B
MKRKSKILAGVLTLLLFITSSIPVEAAPKQDMKIEFINVGAGDAIYIETPSGTDILIDAGSTGNGKKVVDQLLKQEKNMDLEYVISTHPDADHIGGLQEVFKRMKVKKFYYPKDISYTKTKTAKAVLDLAKKEKGCKIYDAKSGMKIKSGGAILEFIHSSKNYSSDNEDSVMTYIDYGNLEVLLTGDAEKGAEKAGKKYNVDVVQAPHHGSKYSSSTDFIKKYDPEKVVVSTDGKRYGHPNKEIFKRYAKYDKNIDVYRTDNTGNIVLRANGKKWWFDKNDKPVKALKYAN